MSNNYFQFKQFTVQQQFCAMKVTTDACIFGAKVATLFAETEIAGKEKSMVYLDIGTGTGLLSLMLAQKSNAVIDAVEIDVAAHNQAKSNFDLSPFKDRLNIYHTDILHFTTSKKYEGIVCNPPFFEGDLQSPDKQKNAAKHDTTLTLKQLLIISNNLLIENGLLAVLVPYHRMEEVIKEALELQFYLKEKILLRHTAAHPYFRAILFLSKNRLETTTKELVIKNKTGNYTDAFIHVLKDYYLHL